MPFREFWLEYRSEVFFGIVLAALTVFSYWATAFLPEDIFEYCINPVQPDFYKRDRNQAKGLVQEKSLIVRL